MTTPADPAAAAAPFPGARARRRLLLTFPPAHLSIFLLWGAIPAVLLPLQMQLLDPANKEANLATVLTLGALVAMITQPVAGALSDRTRSRFGRRAPWLVLGSVGGGLALIGMSQANTLLHVLIAWVIVQFTMNVAQGPLSAVLPDRVPRRLRGTFSAALGIAGMLGIVGGQSLAAALASRPTASYLLLTGLLLTGVGVFVAVNPDRDNRDEPRPRLDLRALARSYWVNPRKHPDFGYAFAGRFLLTLATQPAMSYQLYILQDYVGITLGQALALIPVASLISIVCVIVASAIFGPLSDRLKRRKIFVYGSALAIGCGLAVPLLFPTVPGVLAYAAISSFGYGIFQAVDAALISEVLPSSAHHAKDLGIINIAATLPQTLGPALAGIIVIQLGYVALFPIGFGLAALAALSVLPITSVR